MVMFDQIPYGQMAIDPRAVVAVSEAGYLTGDVKPYITWGAGGQANCCSISTNHHTFQVRGNLQEVLGRLGIEYD
jgi:hypothetical protein